MNIKSQGVRQHPYTFTETLSDYLSKNNITRKPTKQQRVLAWLVASSQAGLKVTRFDAETIGDHCLNSTVSDIKKYYGIIVKRERTKRLGNYGEIDCCQYWLDPLQIEAVEEQLSSFEIKGAA